MLVIYPQPFSLTPITSDCARPNITEQRQRTSPHRNHVQCTVQPRRLPATAGVARILHERLVHDVMGSQDLALLLAVISWLQKRWRSTLGRTSSTLSRASHHLGLAVRFLQFSRPMLLAVILARFCTTYNISAQHCSPSRNVTQITFST